MTCDAETNGLPSHRRSLPLVPIRKVFKSRRSSADYLHYESPSPLWRPTTELPWGEVRNAWAGQARFIGNSFIDRVENRIRPLVGQAAGPAFVRSRGGTVGPSTASGGATEKLFGPKPGAVDEMSCGTRFQLCLTHHRHRLEVAREATNGQVRVHELPDRARLAA